MSPKCGEEAEAVFGAGTAYCFSLYCSVLQEHEPEQEQGQEMEHAVAAGRGQGAADHEDLPQDQPGQGAPGAAPPGGRGEGAREAGGGQSGVCQGDQDDGDAQEVPEAEVCDLYQEDLQFWEREDSKSMIVEARKMWKKEKEEILKKRKKRLMGDEKLGREKDEYIEDIVI